MKTKMNEKSSTKIFLKKISKTNTRRKENLCRLPCPVDLETRGELENDKTCASLVYQMANWRNPTMQAEYFYMAKQE